MQDVWLDLAQQGVMVLAGLMLTAVSLIGSFYIRKLIRHLKQEELLGTVRRYVKWAEQAPFMGDFPGEEKFEVVFGNIMAWAKRNGIPVDEDELGIMIEAAVKEMKDAAAPLLTDSPGVE